MKNIKYVLVLAPHPDDGEFGCGGTLKKFNSDGVETWYVVFSPCNKSLPNGFEKNSIYEELKKAAIHLGIKADKIITYDYPVREFPKYRQEILEELVKLKNKIKPDLVFIPNSTDVHQDHQVMHQEGIRAFKHGKILGYELPWNNLKVTTNFFVSLQKEHIDAKIKAINEYKSQNIRNYKDAEFITGLAKVRVQANTDFAEGFEVIKWDL